MDLNLQKMHFTRLTKNIHTLPIMTIPSKKILPVKKIVAVYQLQYKNGGIYGFGDFIRGCFCLFQLCKNMNLDFDIDLSNHPLSKYLEGHIKTPTINYNNIFKMDTFPDSSHDKELCYTTFKGLLRNVNSNVYYTSTNSFPLFRINQPEIDFIKSKLTPNVEMQQDIEEEMTILNLINYDFSIIHIRTGDDYLFDDNNVLNQHLVNTIFNNLNFLLNDKNRKYLILSDNTKLKMLFKPYENCVFQNKPITHLG
jgi:hypothetical protein